MGKTSYLYTINLQPSHLEKLANIKSTSNNKLEEIISELKTESVSYFQLGNLCKLAEDSNDREFVEAVLDIGISFASAGQWQTWNHYVASGHNGGFDSNLAYQAFLIKYCPKKG